MAYTPYERPTKEKCPPCVILCISNHLIHTEDMGSIKSLGMPCPWTRPGGLATSPPHPSTCTGPVSSCRAPPHNSLPHGPDGPARAPSAPTLGVRTLSTSGSYRRRRAVTVTRLLTARRRHCRVLTVTANTHLRGHRRRHGLNLTPT